MTLFNVGTWVPVQILFFDNLTMLHNCINTRKYRVIVYLPTYVQCDVHVVKANVTPRNTARVDRLAMSTGTTITLTIFVVSTLL